MGSHAHSQTVLTVDAGAPGTGESFSYGHYNKGSWGTAGYHTTSSTDLGTKTSGTPITDGIYGTPRIGAETRPASYALTYCMKTTEDTTTTTALFQESGGDVSLIDTSHNFGINQTSPKTTFQVGADTFSVNVSSGNVGIGTISPIENLQVNDVNATLFLVDTDPSTAAGQHFARIQFNNSDSGNVGSPIQIMAVAHDQYGRQNLEFKLGQTGSLSTVFKIRYDGRLYAPILAGSASVYDNLQWSSADGHIIYKISSRRYKTNITDLDLDTSFIYDLKPRSFDPIQPETNISDGNRTFGVIAEEVEELLIEKNISTNLFIGYKNNTVQSFYYQQLTIPMLNEMQIMKKQNLALKNALCSSSIKLEFVELCK